MLRMAQFKTIPPLELVKELFVATTGQAFHPEISWTSWRVPDPDDLFVFRPYIRNCHQNLLMETANGIQENPCAFLRQLLRPHGYNIVRKRETYTLAIKKDGTTVSKAPGVTVCWGDAPAAPT